MLRIVGEAGYQSGLYKTRGRKWSVVTSLLVSIYRDETAKMKAIERYNELQTLNTPADDDRYSED